MSTALTVKPSNAEAIERVVIQGDLSKLTPEERVNYYRLVCESVGLNPLTKPFEYITLNGKLTLYARKDATDQLRSIHQVSVRIISREVTEGCYVVTAQASFPSGRLDESIGAVPLDKLTGEARANALMKCETKAKRRVTLSACGLGMLDETEIETIPSARLDAPEVQRTTKPIPIPRSPAIETAPLPAKGQQKAEKAEGPQGGGPVGTSAAPPTQQLAESLAAITQRQPGEDDDDTKTFIDEPIDLPRQRALHRAFKDAIRNSEAQKQADTFLREWLKHEGYVDAEGKGTTKTIPVYLFDEVKTRAVAFAANLPK